MAVTIGNLLLRKLVAEKSEIPAETVGKVLDTYAFVIAHLIASGAKVRLGDLGHLQAAQLKATRRRLPGSDTVLEIPARTRVVFKETKPPR